MFFSRRQFSVLAATIAVSALGESAETSAEPVNPFFAMDTAARGKPDAVVPLLKELGYAGLGGQPGDAAMPAALSRLGLRFFNAYHVAQFDSGTSALADPMKRFIDTLKGYDSAIWLAIRSVSREGKPLPASDAAGADIVLERLAELADYAEPNGVRIALYPHSGFWLQHVETGLQLVQKLDRASVGATFNLCHWLHVEGSERDPGPLLAAAKSKLFFVTINGADTGDTKKMGWNRLIQPLGEGTYDVNAFLDKVKAADYRGPIGYQGFGIKMEPRELLSRTMKAWRSYQLSQRKV